MNEVAGPDEDVGGSKRSHQFHVDSKRHLLAAGGDQGLQRRLK